MARIYADAYDVLSIVEKTDKHANDFFNLKKYGEDGAFANHWLYNHCYWTIPIPIGLICDFWKFLSTWKVSRKLKHYWDSLINEYLKNDWLIISDRYKQKNEENIKNNDWYIYVLKSNWIYKIWRAKNIQNRLKKYTTENPFWIDVIFALKVKNYINNETILLKKFKNKQVRWEWFSLDWQDLLFIKEVLKEQLIWNMKNEISA